MSILPPVQNFTVINASARSITVGWNVSEIINCTCAHLTTFCIYSLTSFPQPLLSEAEDSRSTLIVVDITIHLAIPMQAAV